MGQILGDVERAHLMEFPEEAQILKPFLFSFDVTWARRRRAYNTELSVYFLKPEEHIKQLFGFEHEVALFISSFPSMEARTMQAVDILIGEDPARGRVEQSIFFLASTSQDGRAWVKDYTSRNPQARIPVVFDSNEIQANINDSWWVRNVIREQLFSRDLYDYQLPIDSDLFFFGRDQIVSEYFDAIRRSQNRGLFGLRKTGKTSILYKLNRLTQREGLGAFLYYDCKLPSIRMLHWDELLQKIISDISLAYRMGDTATTTDKRKLSDRLLNVMQSTPDRSITTLVFDEIEYISPLAIDDIHWHAEFVPFWQTLWGVQSQIRRLSNLVAGVNPTIVELDTINGIQNPMFGIIQPRYLRGLDAEEMRVMVRTFGRRMGIAFELNAMQYLYERYGGHPLLTRMACSEVHAEIDRLGKSRPFDVSYDFLQKDESSRDAELSFYCRHVVSELKKFYPDEYSVLEMLASGRVLDVMDLDEPEYTRHLKEYGLLKYDTVRRPICAVPVVGIYVGNELARREKRRLVRRVVAEADRPNWVKRRAETITRELRELCRVSEKKQMPTLYVDGNFPEAERFCGITEVGTRDQFVTFINICNRCFVESLERLGKRQRKSDYLWIDIKKSYCDLWKALHRVKVYRHNDLHLELTSSFTAELNDFLDEDLEGRRPSQVPEVWFILQQCVLDDLMLGIQCELNRLS